MTRKISKHSEVRTFSASTSLKEVKKQGEWLKAEFLGELAFFGFEVVGEPLVLIQAPDEGHWQISVVVKCVPADFRQEGSK